MPLKPESKRRPWIPETTKKEHQGRAERSKEYNTARWQRTRRAHLQANPLCVSCQEKGIVKVAEVVDHIEQVIKGGSFYDANNHQGLCTSCHSMKSAKERWWK